jgi:hypothetical protein
MYITIYDTMNTKKRPTLHAQNERATPAVLPSHWTRQLRIWEGVLLDTLIINSINAGRKYAPGRVVAVVVSSAPPGPPAPPQQRCRQQ